MLWIKDAIPGDLVSALRAKFHRRYESLGRHKLGKRYAAVGERRFMISVKVKPPFSDPRLFANPQVMPLLRDQLGPDCLISSFGSVVAFPGADAQGIHFDYPPLYPSEATCASLPPHAITMAVPLVDLTPETGTTAIWKGTHAKVGARRQLNDLAESPSLEGATLPYAKAGDVYLMDFRVIHAGTENLSQATRPLLYIVYCRPWFREDMNFDEQPPLRLSRKRWQRMPPEQQCLFSEPRA